MAGKEHTSTCSLPSVGSVRGGAGYGEVGRGSDQEAVKEVAISGQSVIAAFRH